MWVETKGASDWLRAGDKDAFWLDENKWPIDQMRLIANNHIRNLFFFLTHPSHFPNGSFCSVHTFSHNGTDPFAFVFPLSYAFHAVPSMWRVQLLPVFFSSFMILFPCEHNNLSLHRRTCHRSWTVVQISHLAASMAYVWPIDRLRLIGIDRIWNLFFFLTIHRRFLMAHFFPSLSFHANVLIHSQLLSPFLSHPTPFFFLAWFVGMWAVHPYGPHFTDLFNFSSYETTTTVPCRQQHVFSLRESCLSPPRPGFVQKSSRSRDTWSRSTSQMTTGVSKQIRRIIQSSTKPKNAPTKGERYTKQKCRWRISQQFFCFNTFGNRQA